MKSGYSSLNFLCLPLCSISQDMKHWLIPIWQRRQGLEGKAGSWAWHCLCNQFRWYVASDLVILVQYYICEIWFVSVVTWGRKHMESVQSHSVRGKIVTVIKSCDILFKDQMRLEKTTHHIYYLCVMVYPPIRPVSVSGLVGNGNSRSHHRSSIVESRILQFEVQLN